MTVSDDEWLKAARERAATGTWERPAEAMFRDLKRTSMAKAPGPAVAAVCPFCTGHPPLLRFQRLEPQTIEPLLYCANCYGFWATGGALARGVADDGYRHPALEARVAPRRCRACFGHLKPDNSCAKCGQPLPPLKCPDCRAPMERFENDGITLDQCAGCKGVWFDMGEIVRAYGLPPIQGLAASTTDEGAADDEPPGWLFALTIAARVVLPYLPL